MTEFGRDTGIAMNASKRRTIRATPNPLDKATIVSIFPMNLEEYKPSIFPGKFIVPAGTYDKPSITVVGTSSWFRDVDPEQPILEMVCGSMEVANSIVKDYISSLFTWSEEAKPGLFFIPGQKTLVEIKKDYHNLLDSAKARQDNWYRPVVKIADSLWSRSQNNPLAISDEMRLAAQELGIAKTKAWMQDFNSIELKPCPACGVLTNPQFPVCAHCHTVIDVKKFESLGLKQAV